ncbi:MAG: LCP family protein [Blautia sp.]|nr:LCP family protein [Blautia sp.]
MGRETDNEMRQIQQGLEAFLQQELQEMETERKQRPPEPQLYTIGEEEDAEKELDVIGSASSRKKAPVKKRVREDYYIEDWDSPDRAGQGRRTSQSRGTVSGGRSSQNQKTAAGRRAPQGQQTDSSRNSSQGRQTAPGHRASTVSGSRPQAQKTASRRRSKEKYPEEPVQSSRKSKKKNSRKAAPEPPKKSGKKRGSGLKKFLIAMVLLVALAGGGLYFLVGNVYARMNYESIDSVAGKPLREDGVVNILLIGNDSRQNGEDGRSDAMILLSISNKTKTIYMTSLLRDMYVDIPGHDGNRLNAAYSFGGAELLMETVEENLDIPINRYMLVNFEAFANLVDAVGGVDLELTTGELEYVNGYLVEYNMLTDRPQGTDNMDTTQPGLVHLNGPQALAYCRNRYIGTDFGRTERQRKVLTAVIKKLPAALGANFEELMDGLMPNLTTNLTQGECYRLSLMAGKLLTYNIVSDSVPQPGTYKDATIRKMQVLEVDFDANIKYLKEKIYGETGE